MEHNSKPYEHNRNADQYLRDADHRYVFEVSSGLYKPKSAETDANSKQGSKNTAHVDVSKNKPTWTDVVGVFVALLSLLVGSLTLYGLYRTVHYSRKQWRAMDDTLKEVRGQSKTFQETAQISNDALRLNKRDLGAFFTVSGGSGGGFMPPQLPQFLIYARNIGHTTAPIAVIDSTVNVYEVSDGKQVPTPTKRMHWISRNIPAEDRLPVGGLDAARTEIKRLSAEDVFGPGDFKFLYNSLRNHVVVINAEVTYDDGFGNKLSSYSCDAIFTRHLGFEGQTFGDRCDRLPEILSMRRDELKRENDCKASLSCAK